MLILEQFIEQMDVNILIPTLIAVLGFVSYFFGKIISETLIGIEDRSQSYIFGFSFVLVYILVPLAIIYELKNYLLLAVDLPLGILFIGIFVLIGKFISVKQKVYVIEKAQASENIRNMISRKTKNILLKYNLNHNKNTITMGIDFILGTPSKSMLFLLTIINFWLLSNLIFYFQSIALSIVFLILFIDILSKTVQLVSIPNYPNIVLEDKNGKKYRGRLIKYGKDFIAMRDRHKAYNFVRDNVKYILSEEKLKFKQEKRSL